MKGVMISILEQYCTYIKEVYFAIPFVANYINYGQVYFIIGCVV